MCTLVFILPYLPSFSIHYYMFYYVYSSGGTIHVYVCENEPERASQARQIGCYQVS